MQRSSEWVCDFRSDKLPRTILRFRKPVGRRFARAFLRGLLAQTRQLERLPYGTTLQPGGEQCSK